MKLTKSAHRAALWMTVAFAGGCSQPTDRNLPAGPVDDDPSAPMPTRSLVEGNLELRTNVAIGALRDLSQARSADAADRLGLASARATVDRFTLATKTLSSFDGYLTAPSHSAPADIARNFAFANADLLGVDAADLTGMELTDRVYSRITGATHFYFRQTHAGLPVWGGQLQVHVNRDGRVISANNGFARNLAGTVNTLQPRLAAVTAVRAAASHLGVELRSPAVLVERGFAPGANATVSAPDLSVNPVVVRLALQAVAPGKVRLVHNLRVRTPDGQHAYDMTIDAVSGDVWSRVDWIHGDRYNVYPEPIENPDDGERGIVTDPADPTASPSGWFNAGTTLTRGNNVDAYVEPLNIDGPAPADESGQYADCGAELDCDFPLDLAQAPDAYEDASVANLFYWNNLVHDVQYQYGFDEAAGSFQNDNFGNGGLDGDAVRAEAQDGRDETDLSRFRNNANFFTPPDGQAPQMQMYLWDTNRAPGAPLRDGDFSTVIIAHEYGHGVSTRQVGGPSNSSCLGNPQQFGEGISDFLGYWYTLKATDTGPAGAVIGDWGFGDEVGIRSFPYTTNREVNPHVYSDINAANGQPHATGEKFGQALWIMTWALIDKHGFDPDIRNATGGSGNQRAMLYVNEAFKQTACNPSFTDARDAILLTAREINGDEDLCEIWDAFAVMGIGIDAGDAGGGLPVADGFDRPSNCACIATKETFDAPVFDGPDVSVPTNLPEAVCDEYTNRISGMSVRYNVRGNPTPKFFQLERGESDFAGSFPALPNGTILDASVGVSRDDGSSQRLPEHNTEPFFTLAFGSVEEIYCTDFESDNGGFVFNDGSSFEVGEAVASTFDPGEAFSGTRILGNSLGAEYVSDIAGDTATLTVDGLSGYDNVHLWYRRWLSVEDAESDFATVRVNDTDLFVNDEDDDHIDSQWRFVSIELTDTLAGGDSATIEFGLATDDRLNFGGWNIDDLCIVSFVDPVCGDGTLNEFEGEECDDGNTDAGDGCAANCTIEPFCGDGETDAGEQCDDGNTDNGDGCSATCETEVDEPDPDDDDGGGCSITAAPAPGSVPAALVLMLLAVVIRRPFRRR